MRLKVTYAPGRDHGDWIVFDRDVCDTRPEHSWCRSARVPRCDGCIRSRHGEDVAAAHRRLATLEGRPC